MSSSMAYEQAQAEAFLPFGSSSAGAVVCAALFFLLGCVCTAQLIYTKYTWTDVLIISCFFRAVGYSCRAAYLSSFHPALQGTFLAFTNAGYGATIAVLCLSLGVWFQKKGVQIFPAGVEKALQYLSFLLVVPIVAFGPITGVVAAGLIYGDYRHPSAAQDGDSCRIAATYGLLMTNLVTTILLGCVTVKALSNTERPSSGQKGTQSAARMGKNPRLVAVLFGCSLLLMLRGCTGVVALYQSTEYVWVNDSYFYPLDTLPELIAVGILAWPTLLARTACSWPRDAKPEDEEQAAEQEEKEEEGSKRTTQRDGVVHGINGSASHAN